MMNSSTHEFERLLGKAALVLTSLAACRRAFSKLLWQGRLSFETTWLRTCTTTIRKRLIHQG
jgi:hypothetical protein